MDKYRSAEEILSLSALSQMSGELDVRKGLAAFSSKFTQKFSKFSPYFDRAEKFLTSSLRST